LVTQEFFLTILIQYIMPNFLPNNQDSTAYKELEGALLRQNYFEKWHIFRGWKHGCKVCEECNHHSHLYYKRCKKVAEGIYKRCECFQVI
jgi:hypothetical protein